ncbi:MAG: helix-turn-helix domain-containing protein [Caulobacteraceae bacterium]
MIPDVRMIRSEADYDAAIREYEGYFDHPPAPGTREADRFEVLGLLLAKYEEDTAPVSGDPVETVRLVMEGRGYDRAALTAILGSRSRTSDFLNRKRELTLNQVRRLHAAWRIPVAALIGPLQDA